MGERQYKGVVFVGLLVDSKSVTITSMHFRISNHVSDVKMNRTTIAVIWFLSLISVQTAES